MSTTPAAQTYRLIPYGVQAFSDIRQSNLLYIDKTRFIRELENHRYVFLIRPRRFGKTLLLGTLENYYDRKRVDRFETLFGNLDIGQSPTEERNRYIILRLDFSGIDKNLERLERSFEGHIKRKIDFLIEYNKDLFSDSGAQKILEQDRAIDKLDALFGYVHQHDIPLYVLIDEYDNFANVVFTEHGAEAYHEFTHGDGFYRNFFATLKTGASQEGGGIKRLFITGVSPITMDDVTSGFNIGTNISLLSEFNELLGFTEAEVLGMVEEYRDQGVFNQDFETAMGIMREWYNGYRFSEDSATEVYNTDMVLFYLQHSIPNKRGPRRLMDRNVRIDYEKLRHLMWVNQQLNGNFNILKSILEEGSIVEDLVESFPLTELTESPNFVSLLHYFGLLTISGTRVDQVELRIPNRTIADLMYGYLRAAYEEADIFRLDLRTFKHLITQMASSGDWEPVFTFLAKAIEEQSSVRDYIQGEKMIQGFLLAYLNVTTVYMCRSEVELSKGYVDLFLIPTDQLTIHVNFGYIVEVKYLRRRKSLPETTVKKAQEEAATQVKQYLKHYENQQSDSMKFIGIVLVFHGWEMVVCERVHDTTSLL